MFDFTHKTLNFRDRSYSKKGYKGRRKEAETKTKQRKKEYKNKKEVFRTTAHVR